MPSAMKQSDVRHLLGYLREKVEELVNIVGNLEQIAEFEEEAAAPKPVKKPVYDEQTERVNKCKIRIEKFIKKIDKREGSLELIYLRSTWIAKNNITNELDVITDEFDCRVKIKSYKRVVDRRRPTDPDEKVRNEIDAYVQKTFKWLLDEKRQHRIDIHWPYRGIVAISVR